MSSSGLISTTGTYTFSSPTQASLRHTHGFVSPHPPPPCSRSSCYRPLGQYMRLLSEEDPVTFLLGPITSERKASLNNSWTKTILLTWHAETSGRPNGVITVKRWNMGFQVRHNKLVLGLRSVRGFFCSRRLLVQSLWGRDLSLAGSGGQHFWFRGIIGLDGSVWSSVRYHAHIDSL